MIRLITCDWPVLSQSQSCSSDQDIEDVDHCDVPTRIYRGSDGGGAVAIAEVKAGKKQFFSRAHLIQVIVVQRRLEMMMVEASKRSERPVVRSSAKGT